MNNPIINIYYRNNPNEWTEQNHIRLYPVINVWPNITQIGDNITLMCLVNIEGNSLIDISWDYDSYDVIILSCLNGVYVLINLLVCLSDSSTERPSHSCNR